MSTLIVLLLSSGSAPAAPSESPPPASPSPEKPAAPSPRPPPFKRWFVHLNIGFNVYTYNAATSSAPSQHVTPADRINLGQQIGLGYYVHPNIRVQLITQFGETLTGLPAGASPFSLFAVIPCVFFTARGAFVGVGPFLAPRAFGKNELEIGTFLTGGYSFRLPHGFAVALAVQVPTTLLHRVSVQITPLVSASYRF